MRRRLYFLVLQLNIYFYCKNKTFFFFRSTHERKPIPTLREHNDKNLEAEIDDTINKFDEELDNLNKNIDDHSNKYDPSDVIPGNYNSEDFVDNSGGFDNSSSGDSPTYGTAKDLTSQVRIYIISHLLFKEKGITTLRIYQY